MNFYFSRNHFWDYSSFRYNKCYNENIQKSEHSSWIFWYNSEWNVLQWRMYENSEVLNWVSWNLLIYYDVIQGEPYRNKENNFKWKFRQIKYIIYFYKRRWYISFVIRISRWILTGVYVTYSFSKYFIVIPIFLKKLQFRTLNKSSIASKLHKICESN